ncbi:TlpA family protein disulfide reductase [Saccharicrinis sp. FJH2]|uniref:TlpA family protein disulfide reductase n=1 Tax=Saccharicrinis sp. FJH65 TaxID=3344659 RepID=UPI0035F2393F
MKPVIPCLIAVMLIVSCNKNDSNTTGKKTVITGQFKDPEKIKGHKNIPLMISDLLANEKTLVASIDENRKFRFEIELKYPVDFHLGNIYTLTYHISPGDSLHVQINGDCWAEKGKSYEKLARIFDISGTSEDLNKEITRFMILYNDSLAVRKSYFDPVKVMEPLKYLDYMNKQLESNQAFLNSFNEKEKTSSEFKEWAHTYIKYDNWYYVLCYRYVHVTGTNQDPMQYYKKIPVEYFSFLNSFTPEKNENSGVKRYIDFLTEYSFYIDQLIPTDSLEVYIMNLENNYPKGIEDFTRYYKKISPDYISDLCISKFYYRLLEKKYYPELKSAFNAQLIENDILRGEIQEKYNYEKGLFESPTFSEEIELKKLDVKTNYLQELLKQYQGKVVYIDFWAPWCAPCMEEMPNSSEIKKYFENKDVAFVYLANRCKEEAWKIAIAEKNITGDNYLLTDDQYNELKSLFNIQGIPTYILIDKRGNVVDADAPRPSEKDRLIEEITAHLN